MRVRQMQTGYEGDWNWNWESHQGQVVVTHFRLESLCYRRDQ